MTQREANQLHEFPVVDAANNISNYMVLILTCIFYSPIIPLTIPIALIGSIINYWVYKYMLLRRHKMPQMFSTMMATFFANFMPFVLVVWGISFLVFVQKIHAAFWDEYYSSQANSEDQYIDANVMTQEDFENLAESDPSSAYGAVALIFALICFVLPFRSLLDCMFNSEEADDDRQYKKVCHTFSSDYDRENPLTKQKGV